MESGHLSSASSSGLRPGLVDLEDIVLVPSDQIESYWPFAAPWLAPSCQTSNGRWTMGRVLDDLQSGKQQLLVAVSMGEVIAAVTVAVVPEPTGDVLYILVCGGGNIWRWKDAMREAITLWKNSLGCVKTRIIGRVGWGRIMGLRPVAVVMEG